jgi:hypothetical protein
MVEVALYQRLGTIDMGTLPRRVLAHLVVGIAVAVSLLVRFVHDIDAPAVTKLIEIFTVRIM